jgi:hypothetical protein
MKKNIQNLLPLLLIVLATINIFWLQSPILGIPLGLFYLAYFSWQIGKKLFNSEENWSKTVLGFLFLNTYLIIAGSIFYYLTGLHNWNVIIILLLPIILTFNKKLTTNNLQQIKSKILSSKSGLVSLITYYLLLITSAYILFSHSSSAAIVSPWQAIPSYFFVCYFLLALVLFYKIIRKPENCGFFIFLFTLLSASVALIVYKIGYGFDPFVHRAAEKIIFNDGAVLPKTPYYIGQYSLVIIFAKLFSINFSFFDKILAPLLGSILIPTLAYLALIKNNFSKSGAWFSAVLTGLLTLFSFFFTTPQHLANIFLICFVFLSFSIINTKNREKRGEFLPEDCLSAVGASSAEKNSSRFAMPNKILWLLALAITLIHPIAGIPALAFCFFLIIKNKIISSVFFILSLVAVPLVFFLASLILPNFQISFHWQNLHDLLVSAKNTVFYLSFQSFLHSLYLLKIIFYPLIIILALFGWWKLHKEKFTWFFPAASLILLVNALALKLFSFHSVIAYEQNIFPLRLVHCAYFFVLPFVLISLAYIFEVSTKTKKGVILLLIGVSFYAVSVLYLSYPRYDTINKNKGFAISVDDLTAVRLIEGLGANKNYIVLANQSTSAAALQEFGFKKYFSSRDVIPSEAGDLVFYYPLPTSSPLYQIYLDITYQGIKPELINEAKKITGADTVFLVFTDYWTNFKKLIPEGKNSAKNSFEINGGKIWIFEY